MRIWESPKIHMIKAIEQEYVILYNVSDINVEDYLVSILINQWVINKQKWRGIIYSILYFICLLTPVSSFTSLITASEISSPCKYNYNESKDHTKIFIIWSIINLIYTSFTAPVGIFHTPEPPNLPLVSWTTSTYQMKQDRSNRITDPRYHNIKYKRFYLAQAVQKHLSNRLPLPCHWPQRHQHRHGVKHLQECYQGYLGSNIQASSNPIPHDGT